MPCGEDDHQSHLPYCRSYVHLREGLNLEDSDHDLVLYFQRVVRERERETDRDGDSQSVSEGDCDTVGVPSASASLDRRRKRRDEGGEQVKGTDI